jgi:3-deoxy-D-manno-octulosonic-acid transferase
MNLLYTAYTALTSGIFLSSFPPFWIYTRLTGRHRKGLKERLGLIPTTLLRNMRASSPRIWLHAASLGEVKVARTVKEHLERLIPGCSVIVSTTTDHGRDLALRTLQNTPVIYAPIDTLFSVRKALRRVRPHVMVFLETEIWPSWITEARRIGVKTALINGRISARSIGRYLRLRPFFHHVLTHMDAFSMITEEDAERIRELGAAPHKIQVNGNAKYEALAAQADPAMQHEMRRILNLQPSQTVFVAGSTRSGEEEKILEVFRRISSRFPDTLLVIAPRHISRTPAIESLLRERGIRYQLRTDIGRPGTKRTEPVLIMNTFGELFELYSAGSIIFCGASLVPLGGQNPLEAAAWGKPVFYGPSMEDFQDAKALLEAEGAGIEISSVETFAERAIWFLDHPEAIKACGDRARVALLRNHGAAERHARVIARLLN